MAAVPRMASDWARCQGPKTRSCSRSGSHSSFSAVSAIWVKASTTIAHDIRLTARIDRATGRVGSDRADDQVAAPRLAKMMMFAVSKVKMSSITCDPTRCAGGGPEGPPPGVVSSYLVKLKLTVCMLPSASLTVSFRQVPAHDLSVFHT